MAEITVPFRGEKLRLALPAGWRLMGEHRPKGMAPLAEVKATLLKRLESPTGTGALKKLAGKKIVLAVDDISRPTPLHRFFEVVVQYLQARGARRYDLSVLFALGVHRPMTEEEARAKLGAGGQGLAWFNHDCRDREGLVDLGTTSRGTPVLLNRRLAEADLIITVGAIEPHPLLGFGGGLKMLLPGLAGEETIAVNHMQGVTPARYNYVGSVESPMRLDLEEGVRRLEKPIFIVNAVMNEDLRIADFVCGDPIAAHREGVELVSQVSACPIRERADVGLVVSNPMNIDLRQGMKSIANVEQSVKEGGVIVALLDCAHGIGDVAIPPRSLPNRLLRFILRRLGPGRVLWFVDRVKKGAGTEERFLSHFSLQVLRKNKLLVWSPNLPEDTGRRMGLFRQFATPQDLIHAAGIAAPARAKVHVFPFAGATFPVNP